MIPQEGNCCLTYHDSSERRRGARTSAVCFTHSQGKTQESSPMCLQKYPVCVSVLVIRVVCLSSPVSSDYFFGSSWMVAAQAQRIRCFCRYSLE